MFNSIKRAFNAIGAWILNVFAATMRVCFPQLCCKYFTKKGRRNAKKFLPSLEEQKKAFNAMFTIVVPQHVWSKEFRIWLLQMKEYALIDDCASQEELEEVLFKPCSTEVRTIAVKRCTPSHDTILWFVNETEKFEEVLDLATAVPTAFESLTAKEALGRGTDKHSDLMWTLINKYSARATDYLEFILSSEILKERCKDDVPLLTDIAIAKQLDLMPYLAQLKAEYPAVYAKVREHAMDMGSNSVSLVLKGFSLTSWALPAHMGKAYPKLIEDLNTVSIYGELEECYDAMAWLSICYQMMAKQDICNMILKNWDFIKDCVSDTVYQQLSCRLVEGFSNAHQGKQVIKLVDEGLKPKAIDRLLDVLKDSSGGQLSDLFPFKGWNAKQQEKAIRLMAVGKTLPMDRMNELSQELQKLAIEELEIQSELRVIQFGGEDAKKELVKHKLHSRSEVQLFCHSMYMDRDCSKQYIQNYEMDEHSFAAMITRVKDDYGNSLDVSELITLHARQWELSTANYLALLQSNAYCRFAPLLKEHLKKDTSAVVVREPSFEDGV